jgi:hypothetical protein
MLKPPKAVVSVYDATNSPVEEAEVSTTVEDNGCEDNQGMTSSIDELIFRV